jgi:hypothetical protein
MGWTILLAAGIFGMAILAMAIGVMVTGRRLRGSCGGLANLQDEAGNTLCEACTEPSPECRGEPLLEE